MFDDSTPTPDIAKVRVNVFGPNTICTRHKSWEKPVDQEITKQELIACHVPKKYDLAVAKGELHKPSVWDPVLEVLTQRGALHEQSYLDHLKGNGFSIVRIGGVGVDAAAIAGDLAASYVLARAHAICGVNSLWASILQGGAVLCQEDERAITGVTREDEIDRMLRGGVFVSTKWCNSAHLSLYLEAKWCYWRR